MQFNLLFYQKDEATLCMHEFRGCICRQNYDLSIKPNIKFVVLVSDQLQNVKKN